MFTSFKPERPIVITLLVLLCIGIAGVLVGALTVYSIEVLFAIAFSLLVVLGCLGLYLAGFDWARLLAALLLPVLCGLFLPEPFVTTFIPLSVLIGPAIALVLANPAWMLAVSALQLLLLIWRAGFTGVYTEPLPLALYWLIIGTLLLARYVMDVARRRAEDQSRLLEQERALLERRVAERTAELEAANAELREATQLRDMFLASVSHELRTPLNIILGSVEVMQEGIYGSLTQRQQRALATVAESGEHLLELINDILDLAKMEAGTFEIAPEVVDLRELCAHCAQLIAPAAERKGLTIELQVDESVGAVEADHRRLRQILLNLLSNAVKFTPVGKVGLDVRSLPGGEVEFAVWDTGIGIAAADQRELFLPFRQLDRRLARQYEGTGLGLALVAQLVERHGGAVGVTSALGEGSRFWVRLPATKKTGTEGVTR